MKVASEQIDENLPQSSLVEVVDPAVIPMRCSTPDRVRSSGLILFGGVLDLMGVFLLRRKSVAAAV